MYSYNYINIQVSVIRYKVKPRHNSKHLPSYL